MLNYFLDKQQGSWVAFVEHALLMCREILKLESWKCTNTGLVNLSLFEMNQCSDMGSSEHFRCS